MNKVVRKENRLKAAASLIVPILFLMMQPMDMTIRQSAILGGLFLVVIWWGTGWVHKDVASATLIAIFIGLGDTPLQQVLYFPLSENIIMIVAAYLLSQGIVNSHVADQFSNFVLEKYCTSSLRMVVVTFVLCTLLIFIIPQPFPRVVLLAAIYMGFLQAKEVNEEMKKIMIFPIFVAATITSLLFLNGDVIANYAALGFAQVEMDFFTWMKYMTIPTLAVSVLVMCTFILTFKKNLSQKFERASSHNVMNIGRSGKKALVIMAFIIVLWLTESYHGISAAKIAAVGVLAMFLFRIIGSKDWKVINLSLLLFLTAEFSIGRVLINSGVADAMKNTIMDVLPNEGSQWFLPVIVLSIMGLHMIMGSIITALSFSIPMLIVVTEQIFPPEFIALLVLVSVAFHYILPFHHVTIMIGFGSEYYDNRHVMKIGIPLTIVTLFSVFAIYIPWWRLMGML